MINPFIFRAYDIRGIASPETGKPVDLTLENSELIGKGFGTFLRQKDLEKVVVGRDNRATSDDIATAFICGLLSTGCQVVDIGVAISPLLYFAVCHGHFDGGVMITASHNPPEYNGFKLMTADANPLSPEEIQDLREIIEEKDFIFEDDCENEPQEDSFFIDYVSFLKKRVNFQTFAKMPKIVIDCGNGTGSFFAPQFFKEIGCEVIELYCKSDPTFPNHLPDPEEEKNVEDLKKKVVETGADLGLAFDGDADRVGLVDEKGQKYSADLLLILLARDLLTRNPNAKIVYDLKSTQNLKNEIERLGGQAVISKTGHSFVKKLMKEEGALLGGEVSGHIFLAEDYFGFDDAFLTGALLVEILAKAGKPVAEHFRDLPKTFVTPEIKVACADNVKFSIVEKTTVIFQKKYQCLTIDGVRIDFGDNAWGLVRASNTSPYLTLRFEALTKEKLEQVQDEVRKVLKQFKEVGEW